jgi:hypothetical protein
MIRSSFPDENGVKIYMVGDAALCYCRCIIRGPPLDIAIVD